MKIRFALRFVRNRIIEIGHRLTRTGVRSIRAYSSYEDYVSHQKEKTTDPARVEKWLNEEWEVKLRGFEEIFDRNRDLLTGKSKALCLGARTGQEVHALIGLGLEAIGVDLVPFEPYTVEGDIHDLSYDAGSFDFVFTNIFDHCLYPEKFCSEMSRVTAPGGIIMIHLFVGIEADNYAETQVFDPSRVLAMFDSAIVVHSRPIKNLMDSMNWELVLQRGETTV